MFREKAQWQSIILGDILKLKHGYAFKSKYYSDDGHYILLTPGNFKEDGGLQLKGSKEKYFIGEFSEEYLLKRRDLLVVLTDLKQTAPILGASGFIPQNNKYLHNQRLGKVINWDSSKIDIDYLYYLFNFDGVRGQIKGSATGSTVRHTSPERIYQVQVVIPPVTTQNKIASILSTYDRLIENNTRRIKILESMAQTLYQEWFVKFRFPGCEKVKMVESDLGLIPEGWEVKKLGNIADINKNNINKNNAPERINYINITSVSPGRINEIETMDFDDAPSRARRLVKHGDIIWSTVRPNRKSYSLIMNPMENSVASTGFAVISDKKTAYSYLYHALTTDDFVHYLTNNATGSAYPAVNTNDFKNADIVLPEKNIVDRFNSIVEDMLFEKENLQQKNINLRKTRDLLLPKLISGQIDVENLDIDTGELAA